MSESNPLAQSKSPFLRHGAEQPVAWLPWGEEAFRRAREEDRPVLLDIGAVWCHWCHVMDRESYEDPDTAALINELFVPVKVDRDERPDVDARYQRAVQSVVGVGGWPLTAFLTPTGEVFHGGTYFPPEDTQGRPGFRRVLREVARVWSEERSRVRELADAINSRTATVLTGEAAAGDLGPGLIDSAVDALSKAYDPRNGGFGQAPKFPNTGALGLLLDEWLDTGSVLSRDMVRTTLDAMVAGGIHDHVGGGFHRYSTDARWIIPISRRWPTTTAPCSMSWLGPGRRWRRSASQRPPGASWAITGTWRRSCWRRVGSPHPRTPTSVSMMTAATGPGRRRRSGPPLPIPTPPRRRSSVGVSGIPAGPCTRRRSVTFCSKPCPWPKWPRR